MKSLEKKAYTIAETCEVTRVGRTKLYAAIRAGELVARKIGRRTVILQDELDQWLKGRPTSVGQHVGPLGDKGQRANASRAAGAQQMRKTAE